MGPHPHGALLVGLDFGDCHRSLHGHTESVMCVAFVRETHFFFSASKDRTIRYWDADRFDQILILRAHHGEGRGRATINNACPRVRDVAAFAKRWPWRRL